MEWNNNKSFGIIGTILVHAIVVGILLLFGFSTPEIKYPEPDSITIDFGNEVALGEEVIGDVDGAQSDDVSIPATKEDVSTKPVSQVTTQPQESNVKTKPTLVEDETPVPELTAEEKKRIEDQKKIDALTRNFAQGGGMGSEGKGGNSDNGSQNGDPGNSNGGNSKNTKGNPGNPYGILDAIHAPKPYNTSGCSGEVTVNVIINSDGKVVKINGEPETGISNQACIEAAIAVAKQATFPKDSREKRYAKLTYNYTVH